MAPLGHRGFRHPAAAQGDAVPPNAADWVSTAVAAHFAELAEPDRGLGVSLAQLLRFLKQAGILGSELDHGHVLEAYLEATDGDAELDLDAQDFRAALQAVATRLHAGDMFGGSRQAANEPTLKVVALQEMLRSAGVHRAGLSEASRQAAAASELNGLLHDPEVIRAAYEYRGPLYALFLRRATRGSGSRRGSVDCSTGSLGDREPGFVRGRAAYQLCREIGLVPECVVAGELADLARELALLKAGGQLSAAELSYFNEDRMLSSFEEYSATCGEPHYSFSELVEVLVAAALWKEPRVHLEELEVRARRVRGVLAHHLGSLSGSRSVGAEPAPEEGEGWPVDAILARLSGELPPLPAARDAQLPEPPVSAVLQPQPPAVEERIEKARAAAASRGRPAVRRRLSRKKTSGSKDAGRRRRPRQESAPKVDLPVEKVVWYKKQPPVLRPGMPPQDHAWGHAGLYQHYQPGVNQGRQTAGDPVGQPSGFVLRMAFIDEPLRAPHCHGSTELATLIETAITSRRLRRYDTAASLLIEARRLWSAREGGQEAASLQAWAAAPATERSLHLCSGSTEAPHGSRGPRQQRYKPEVDFAEALGSEDSDACLLPPEVGLFFLCELASLHSAMHHDGMALQLLWRALAFSDRLPAGHPDAAAVWGSLGRVAFLAGHREIAARALFRARCIREETVGEDTVEAATAYNNLACCLSALGRQQEALAFLELAAEILRALAGHDHPRTQTALRNLEKARTAQKNMQMEVPHLFSYRVKVPAYTTHPKRHQKKRRHRSRRGSRGSRRGSNRGSSSRGVSQSTSPGSRRSSRSQSTRRS